MHSSKPRRQTADVVPPPRRAPLDDIARDVAIRALARLARAWPDLPADAFDAEIEARQAIDSAALRPVDRALAGAIYHAAVQRWLTLAHLLHPEIRQGFEALEPRLRAVLLAGAAQIFFMDRVPVHAVINHGVEWAKLTVRPGAGGLVNAVLRKLALLREQCRMESTVWSPSPDAIPVLPSPAEPGGSALAVTTLRLPAPMLPSDPLENVAIALSCPLALLQQWLKTCTQPIVFARALHGLCHPPVILNVERTDSVQLGRHSSLISHHVPRHSVFSGPPSELSQMLASLGDAWVQDPASAGAIRSINNLRPTVIIDLCAGQGTKTRQLAAAFPQSEILATDIHAGRYSTLAAAFSGSSQVKVLPMARLRDQALGRADLVVLDVPCSNTGVLPRRPEARYRFSAAALGELVNVQRQILADSIPLLSASPQAAILYSTCSLEPEENGAHAQWMHKWHGFSASRTRIEEPAGLPGDPPERYQDGGFSILFSRGKSP